MPGRSPLPREEGATQRSLRTFVFKMAQSRPEPGLDWSICSNALDHEPEVGIKPSADLLVLVCKRHELLWPNSHPFEDTLLAGSAAILCAGGLDVIRKEAWSFYRTISGVRLCWELEEPGGPKGPVNLKC